MVCQDGGNFKGGGGKISEGHARVEEFAQEAVRLHNCVWDLEKGSEKTLRFKFTRHVYCPMQVPTGAALNMMSSMYKVPRNLPSLPLSARGTASCQWRARTHMK